MGKLRPEALSCLAIEALQVEVLQRFLSRVLAAKAKRSS